MTEPFDLAWVEREMRKATRTQLIPGLVLTLFWVAGTIVSFKRGDWTPIIVLTLLAGLPGVWLLKGGLDSREHPLVAALRRDPARITSVAVEWRGGGNHYDGRVVAMMGRQRWMLVPPKGREEELATWLRTMAAIPAGERAS